MFLASACIRISVLGEIGKIVFANSAVSVRPRAAKHSLIIEPLVAYWTVMSLGHADLRFFRETCAKKYLETRFSR